MPEKKNKLLRSSDTVSFIVLFLAAGLFFYIAFYRTAEENKTHFMALTRIAEDELKVLSDARTERNKETSDGIRAGDQKEWDAFSSNPSVSDVSMFLQKINNETINSGVELNTIEKIDNITYKMTALAPFSQFVYFLFKIEQSNLAIQELEILPFTNHKNLFKITLRVINDRMSNDNLRTLDDFKNLYANTMINPSGKTDPFESFMTVMKEVESKKRQKPRTYLETLDLSQLRLIAVVVSPKGRWAMVSEAKGNGHVIKKGTAIGKNGGVVHQITDKEVVIREPYKDLEGRTKYRDIVKKVPPLQ